MAYRAGMDQDERLGPMIQRLRVAAGLSQDELADRVQARVRDGGALDRGTVSRWEREKRLTGPYWIRPLAEALGVPVAQLQAARGVSRSLRRSAPATVPSSPTELLSGLLPPMDLAPLSTVRGRRVGHTEASVILRRVHGLRLADDVLPGVDLLGPVTRELRSVVELYNSTSHTAAVGKELLTGVAELAQLAGWVAYDTEGASAEGHFHLGLSAAEQVGDPALTSLLTGTYGYFLTNRGERRRGLDLARSAVSAARSPGVPPRARVCAWDRLAWAATSAGDSQLALRAVEESSEALTAYQEGEDSDWAWLYWVGEPESTIMRARVYTELRRPLRAVPLLRTVLAGYDPTHAREMALYLSWLTVALADANEPEEAAAVAGHMLETCTAVPSARAEERRQTVLSALRPHAASKEVNEVLRAWGD